MPTDEELTPSLEPADSPVSRNPRNDALPAWLWAADIFVLLLLAASASIALFGGFRIRLAGIVMTGHSSARPLALAVVLVSARHLIRRTPTMFSRLRATLDWLRGAESVRMIAPTFLWSRAGVLLVAYLSVSTFGSPTAVTFRVSRNELVNLPARWDGGWYLGVASEGYRYDPRSKGQQNVAFFPAYPMITRIVGLFLGGHTDEGTARYSKRARLIWTGVLVNLAAFAAALDYLYRMVRAVADRAAALTAVQLALAYPLAFIFNAPYTEGLFLLALVATFYHFGRAELPSAAFWGVLAGLTRPNGFLVSVPLIVIALARSGPFPHLGRVVDRLNALAGPETRLTRDLAAALGPIVGMSIFSIFLYLSWGEPFLWAKLHGAWGRTYQGLEPALDPVYGLMEHGVYVYTTLAAYEILHVMAFLLAVGLAIPIAWRLGVAYALLILLTVLPPLLAGGWLSMARFTVVLFPMYVFMALALPVRHRVGVIVFFSMVQALGAALFFTWRPFY